MMKWLAENLGTIMVSLVLAGVAALIVAGRIKSKKAGKSSCCGSCSHCDMCAACRQKPQQR